jgi:hypothetical protein
MPRAYRIEGNVRANSVIFLAVSSSVMVLLGVRVVRVADDLPGERIGHPAPGP